MSLFPLSNDFLLCPVSDEKFSFPTGVLTGAEQRSLSPAAASRTCMWLLETWSFMSTYWNWPKSQLFGAPRLLKSASFAMMSVLPVTELLFPNPLYPVLLSFNLQLSLIVEINMDFILLARKKFICRVFIALAKFLLGTSLGIPFWGLRVVQKVCQVYGLGSAKWIATVACHELEQ